MGLVLAPSAFADYGGTVLADNPLGYWQLGDASGPTAVDSSGDGLDGAYAGSVTFGVSSPVYGASDTAVELNGDDGTGLGPGSISFTGVATDPIIGDFTFEAWVNPGADSTNEAIASAATVGSSGCISSPGWALTLSATPPAIPVIRFELDTGPVSPSGTGCVSASQLVLTSSPTVNVADGGWHYLALSLCHTCDTATLTVDGANETSTGIPSGAVGSNPLVIGDPDIGAVPDGEYLGADDVAFYAYALDQSQVAAHYSLGATGTSSGGGSGGASSGTGVNPGDGGATTTPKPPPLPAPVSVSHYITTSNWFLSGAPSAASYGCAEAKAAAKANRNEELVLLFGVQRSDYATSTPTVLLPGSSNVMRYSYTGTATPKGGIVQWVEAYAQSWYSCARTAGDTTTRVTVAVGTNNDSSAEGSAYGAAWANKVVKPIRDSVYYSGAASQVLIFGADDIEPGFHGTAVGTMKWADGWYGAWASAGQDQVLYINVGSADGCSDVSYKNTLCAGTWSSPWPQASTHCPTPSSNHWNQCAVWWVSYGETDAVTMPEIYYDTTKNYAHQGLQWAEISRYSWYIQGISFWFDGPLVTTAGYTPLASWNQFWCDLDNPRSTNTCGTGRNADLGPDGIASTNQVLSFVSKVVWQ